MTRDDILININAALLDIAQRNYGGATQKLHVLVEQLLRVQPNKETSE